MSLRPEAFLQAAEATGDEVLALTMDETASHRLTTKRKHHRLKVERFKLLATVAGDLRGKQPLAFIPGPPAGANPHLRVWFSSQSSVPGEEEKLRTAANAGDLDTGAEGEGVVRLWE
jgi:hypothetical protein